MNKKLLLISLLLIISSFLFSCEKKETKLGNKTYDISKNYTICIAEGSESSEVDAMRKGFVVKLKDLGLVEDLNVSYYYENAKGNPNYAEQIAESFKTHNPDLILTIGNTAVSAIKEQFTKTPIIFLGVTNAASLGLCDSDGNPTSNLTGVIDSHLLNEQLEYIEKNHTDIKSLGIIYQNDNSIAKYDVDYLKFYATNYDIDIYTVTIKKDDDVDKALDNIIPKVDALMLVYDNIVNNNIDNVINKAKSNNMIVFGQTEEHKSKGAETPALRDYRLVGEKGAEIAWKILVDNKKVKDIKVETVDFKAN